jgi:hypothetical protein
MSIGKYCLLWFSIVTLSASPSRGAPQSEATQECLECHAESTPGIVHDWSTSRHSLTTPQAALKKPALERRMSAESVPARLKAVVVGCAECHAQNPDAHPDTVEHSGHRIHTVVTPADCRTCHPVEVEQFSSSKKAHAVDNLESNPLFKLLVDTVLDAGGTHGRSVEKTATRAISCLGCHGTRVAVTGKRKVETDQGEMEFANLSGWPNQGVGRVNPDKTLGACTACHPRHGFSIEVARKPDTCGQCHLEPDVPAYNVYRESKHGNLERSLGAGWNWTRIPWRPGADFTAPTCAACHNALLTSGEGEEIAPRTHDFGARLWVRLFGLPLSHPQPKNGATHHIRNADKQPLPVTFDGRPATGFLIDQKEQSKRRNQMARVCQACHSSGWVEGHLVQMERVAADADRMVQEATRLIQLAWKRRRADKKNPFDEVIERLWVRQWLFYANSVRYAAAMSGPDYAAFKNGWWNLTENLQKLQKAVSPVSGKRRSK